MIPPIERDKQQGKKRNEAKFFRFFGEFHNHKHKGRSPRLQLNVTKLLMDVMELKKRLLAEAEMMNLSKIL